MPEESPEDRRRRCERTFPILHANKKIDGQLSYIVWMMRLLFAFIVAMVAWKPHMVSMDISGPMVLFMLFFSIGSAEFIYWRGKKMAGEARLHPAGITLSPIRLYGGLYTIKERDIPREEIARVEVARSKDVHPAVLASQPSGAPVSLVLHLSNGRLLTLHKRSPSEVMAAAEYAEVIWDVAREDDARRTPAKPGDVYREFVNDHRSSDFKITGTMLGGGAAFFIGLGVWEALDGIGRAEIFIDLLVLGMAAFMLLGIKLVYDRSYAIRSVRVERDGIALVLRKKTRFVPYDSIRALRIMGGNEVSREKERVAMVQISNRRVYLIKKEIALAIEQAYRERTGREVPDPTTVVPKKGAISQADANVLKYENPTLYRKNLIIAAALMANGFFLFMNVVIRSPLLIMVGAVLLVILMFFRLQISKEMREYLDRRVKEADRPGA